MYKIKSDANSFMNEIFGKFSTLTVKHLKQVL